MRELLKKVFEVDAFNELDYSFAEKNLINAFGCTAAAKKAENGDMLIGRNLDLYISKNPAYIVRTKVAGCYETLGVSYFAASGPDYEDVLKNGLDKDYLKLLPFLCEDIINEKGLYIEINMRMGEKDESGKLKFFCEGTNKNSKKRVFASSLPRYIAERCASVKDALDYVKELDIYTNSGEKMNWNFCFLIADQSGDFGVLEIAENKLSWLGGQPAQTNFYLSEEFSKKQEYKIGIDRYNTVIDGLFGIKNEEDFFSLMKKVSYFQTNHPDICAFDYRSEYSGFKPHWSYEYVMAEENRAEIDAEVYRMSEKIKKQSRAELEENGEYWESAYTLICNCRKKSFLLRFFEDDNRMLKVRL